MKKAAESYTQAADVIRKHHKEGECELFKQLLVEEALIYIRVGQIKDITHS
jgi:hypothetical protein